MQMTAGPQGLAWCLSVCMHTRSRLATDVQTGRPQLGASSCGDMKPMAAQPNPWSGSGRSLTSGSSRCQGMLLQPKTCVGPALRRLKHTKMVAFCSTCL